MNVVELIASAVIGAALLWLVLQPMLSPMPAATVDFDLPDPEETPRGQALLALKEIEFDRATGKLSDSDYELLSARYTAAAVLTLSTCSSCGAPLPGDAVYCPACGVRVIAPASS